VVSTDFTVGMGLNFTVLPQYWVQNMWESRGHGDQACGTTSVMGLGLHGLWTDAWTGGCICKFQYIKLLFEFLFLFYQTMFHKVQLLLMWSLC